MFVCRYCKHKWIFYLFIFLQIYELMKTRYSEISPMSKISCLKKKKKKGERFGRGMKRGYKSVSSHKQDRKLIPIVCLCIIYKWKYLSQSEVEFFFFLPWFKNKNLKFYQNLLLYFHYLLIFFLVQKQENV